MSGKSKLEYKCNYCKGLFSKQSNLTRHYVICKEKEIFLHNKNHNLEKNLDILKLENEKKILEEKLKSTEKEKKLLKRQNTILDKENEYHKQLVISAGTMIQSSMSTLNHLISNYNNAPILEPLNDYSVISDKDKFVNNLIYYHNENKLDQYLGKFLVKKYKTDDPKIRSSWNSDTSRLTYINRELVNNKPNWVIDKKGVKMTNITIDPLLDYIKIICQEKVNILNKETEIDNDNSKKKIFYDMISLNEIIKGINNQALSKDINKFLAPHFYFDKNNLLVAK